MFVGSIHQAKTHLSELIKQAVAGEEVVIGKAGKPIAKLVRFEPSKVERKPGALKGKIKILEGFDEIPPEFEKAINQTIDEDLT